MGVHDKQRRRKVYPFEGHRVAPIMVSEGIGVIDKGAITFTAASTATQTFAVNVSFKSAPRISVTPVGAAGQANINVYITSVTTSQFTVETSAPFTGTIDWIAAGD